LSGVFSGVSGRQVSSPDLLLSPLYENWDECALEISIKLRGTFLGCFVIRR
jgi:hypothetical protein